jgi:hypothetical protein
VAQLVEQLQGPEFKPNTAQKNKVCCYPLGVAAFLEAQIGGCGPTGQGKSSHYRNSSAIMGTQPLR